jgi:hypothetical protein
MLHSWENSKNNKEEANTKTPPLFQEMEFQNLHDLPPKKGD